MDREGSGPKCAEHELEWTEKGLALSVLNMNRNVQRRDWTTCTGHELKWTEKRLALFVLNIKRN